MSDPTDAQLTEWAEGAGAVVHFKDLQHRQEVAPELAQRVLDLIALIDSERARYTELLRPLVPDVGEVFVVEIEGDRFGVSCYVNGDRKDDLAEMLTALRSSESTQEGNPT